MRAWPALLLVVVLFAGCADRGPGQPTDATTTVAKPSGGGPTGSMGDLVKVPGSFSKPLLVTHDGARTFVVEQGGKVKLLDGTWKTYIDIGTQISGGSEQGLLGLAFDPADPTRMFVSYTANNGDSVLERWTAGITTGAREAELLRVDQPDANHNGGHIAFGRDGMLYYGLGDGGGANDVHSDGSTRNAQNLGNLLGKILRLDVSGKGYTVPDDNPFVDQPGARAEIWHYGLRNPWRFSFDAAGNLWIGDVGQDAWEEIDRVTGAQKGLNFGWPAYEGTHRYLGLSLEHTPPIAEYANQGSDCSVTGGHVAGTRQGSLAGAYLFADYCSGKVWTLRPDGAGWKMTLFVDTPYFISSFGTDHDGELYVVNHNGGAIYRFD